MAKKEEITFEVQILTGSRWEAQGVYGAREQGVAVTDAKSLERVSTIKAVRVVKEFYDKKTQCSRSMNVYESKVRNAPKQPAPKQPVQVTTKKARPASKAPRSSKSAFKSAKAKASRKSAGGSMSDAMVSAPPPLEKAVQRPPLLGALWKTLIALVTAIVAAIVVTQLVSMSLRQSQVIGMMKRDDFLIVIFILVFAIMSLTLIVRILSNLKPMASRSPSVAKPQKPTPVKTLLKADSDVAYLDELEALNKVIAQADEREAREVDAHQKDLEKAQDEQDEQDEHQTQDEISNETITMQAFTTKVLSMAQGNLEHRDAHMVFGLVLFLVGAVQALRQQKNTSEVTFKKMATQSLGELGLSQERAERFIENTDEYLISNSRYSQMFQSGRTLMTSYLEDNVEPREMLVEVLSEWDKPKPKTESNQPVTVLFTDIVGSTAMTQKLGDEGAQEIVRIHNTIVREAIHVFTGKEIKHTGDGIMASFSSTASGVEAACDIQRKVKAHSKAYPDRPLELKIGLNAGEPISEDDDLFGSTVQLAARIVDAADTGNILVSSSVQGLCQGKNLKFEKFGDLEMKGFDDPVPVYRVIWEPQPPKPQVAPVLAPVLAPLQTEAQTDAGDAKDANTANDKNKDRPQRD